MRGWGEVVLYGRHRRTSRYGSSSLTIAAQLADAVRVCWMRRARQAARTSAGACGPRRFGKASSWNTTRDGCLWLRAQACGRRRFHVRGGGALERRTTRWSIEKASAASLAARRGRRSWSSERQAVAAAAPVVGGARSTGPVAPCRREVACRPHSHAAHGSTLVSRRTGHLRDCGARRREPGFVRLSRLAPLLDQFGGRRVEAAAVRRGLRGRGRYPGGRAAITLSRSGGAGAGRSRFRAVSSGADHRIRTNAVVFQLRAFEEGARPVRS